jgi:hypothetical protein
MDYPKAILLKTYTGAENLIAFTTLTMFLTGLNLDPGVHLSYRRTRLDSQTGEQHRNPPHFRLALGLLSLPFSSDRCRPNN